MDSTDPISILRSTQDLVLLNSLLRPVKEDENRCHSCSPFLRDVSIYWPPHSAYQRQEEVYGLSHHVEVVHLH
jgi:hypothetical protein